MSYSVLFCDRYILLYFANEVAAIMLSSCRSNCILESWRRCSHKGNHCGIYHLFEHTADRSQQSGAQGRRVWMGALKTEKAWEVRKKKLSKADQWKDRLNMSLPSYKFTQRRSFPFATRKSRYFSLPTPLHILYLPVPIDKWNAKCALLAHDYEVKRNSLLLTE